LAPPQRETFEVGIDLGSRVSLDYFDRVRRQGIAPANMQLK
jgi:hypothetical protein